MGHGEKLQNHKSSSVVLHLGHVRSCFPKFVHPSDLSWQSYVDDQLLAAKTVTKAAIAGHDGNLWATSQGFGVTAEEMKVLLSNMGSTDVFAMSGLKVLGGCVNLAPINHS